MDDKRIIELLFERSEQALDILSDKYGALCSHIAGNILSSKEDAEETVNEAYLAVWNTVPPERPDPLSAFISRIVRNLALKRLRTNTAMKRGSGLSVSLEELEGCVAAPSGVEEQAEARELGRLINSFLASLPKDERVLFVRRYYFCDSIDGLAELFHTSGHNVSARLYRTREKLRKYLRKEGAEI
ncbi:MAG: sigma-70 family RNA polymerase sigma factor [Ruminococcus sp.]|nr:sigma-70 family RNA polymerase sigma factor [Ruminococcus sp.]